MELSNKTILITGGSIGIGYSIAKELLAQNNRVIICARTAESLEQAQKSLLGLETFVCDVRKMDQILALRNYCLEQAGGIDMLINNAAVFRRFSFLDPGYPLEKQLEEIDINLNGSIRMVHAFLPHLLERKEAVIVNLTSPSAFIPMAAAPIYSTTKAAIQSWTQSLRKQLDKTSVRVVELNPPAVDTRMNQNNPGTEGLKLMSPQTFAQIFVKQLQKDRKEIMPSHAGLLKRMRRLAPNLTFRMMNKG